MIKRIAVIVGCVLSLLFVAAIAFVIVSVTMFPQGSAGATLSTGRSISASANHWYLMMENSADSATIRTAGRTIVVEPTRVLVDGRFVAPIAAAAKAIEVKITDGQVAFIADGRPVERDADNEVIRE